jgi:hypothetical protein
MRIPLVRCAGAACILLLLAPALHAAGARFWQIATQSEFLKGDVQNLSIDQYGRLTLGPELKQSGESSTPFLWALIAGPDGSVFAGSGNDGQVYRFTADGKRTVFFDAPELEVHALASAPDGSLYVGTSPDGKIYKVTAKGQSTVYFDPEDKYIWALAVDRSGTLYAATGEKGVIYRITGAGKGEPFYRTKATHAVALLFEPGGDLLAGTEAPGKVFRIKKDGSGFVLLDSGLEEISSLRVGDGGTIYAAAFTGRPSQPERPSTSNEETAEPPTAAVPSVSTEITAVSVIDLSGVGSGTSAAATEPQRPIRGAVYRILPDGAWDTLWESSDDAPYDVLAEPGGSLLVATGNKGKVYRLDGDPVRATLVARADAQQATSLLRDAHGPIWVATANPGKLFKLSTTQASRGSFESNVRDAETVATWGTISWRGTSPAGTTVKLYTRSGNTEVPDETWSVWSDAYTHQDGEQITSPKARYLQWKVELTGSSTSSPLVTSVTAAYLQRNLRPEVTSITLQPPGIVFQKPFSTGEMEIAGFDAPTDRRTPQAIANAMPGLSSGTPPLGRRGYQKGLQTILWKASDENDDDLQYDVLYRREGEASWKPLKRNLSDPIFVWDTTSVPNGTYIVKIVAGDGSSNPPGTSLTGERESRAFDIDNAPPVIDVTSVTAEGARAVISFSVTDEFSAVQRVEYSLDADRWRPIYPKDGIADSPSEQFELRIDGDVSDRAVIIRATDSMNNVATARAEAAQPRAEKSGKK